MSSCAILSGKHIFPVAQHTLQDMIKSFSDGIYRELLVKWLEFSDAFS